MNSEQKTNWILACALLSGLASIGFLSGFNSEDQDKTTDNLSEIARVEDIINDAKLREKKSLSWSKLRVQESINENSTVFVGPQSSLNLKLSDSSIVVLGPSSVVTLSKPNREKNTTSNIAFEITVKKGQVQVKRNSAKPNENLRLKLADLGTVILKENDSIVAIQNDEHSSVQVDRGSPSLEVTTFGNMEEVALPKFEAGSEIAAIEFTSEAQPVIKIEKALDHKLPTLQMSSLEISEPLELESINNLQAMNGYQIKPKIESTTKPHTEDPSNITSQAEPSARAIAQVQAETPESVSAPAVANPQHTLPVIPPYLAAPPEVPKLEGPPSLAPPERPAEFWLWAGVGANYQYYKQTVPELQGDSTFNNIQAPTFIIRGGFQGELWGLDASYRDTPGEMVSSPSVTVANGKYNWRTMTIEGLHRIERTWNLRFGIQHHAMPFMVLDADTATLYVTSNTVTMGTVGFDRSFFLSDKLRAECMMRYQHPISSGASSGATFKINPHFAFDGSVSGVYYITKPTRLGLYWYGQWQQYDFEYKSGSTEFNGAQNLFYSNIEIHLGFEF